MTRGLLRWSGLAVGAGLFGWLLLHSDLKALASLLNDLSWRFVLVLAFYAVIFALDTLGWKFTLPPAVRQRVRFSSLFRIRLAGEAINYVTPTAWIGGEPVKAVLLSQRHGIPMMDGLASVVVAKTTFSLSMLLFIVVGLSMAFATQPLPLAILNWVWIVLPILAFLMGLFLMVQFFQPFGRTASLFGRWRPAWFEKAGAKLRAWDEAVVAFYRRSPKLVAWSFMFHFLGWIAGALEVGLILWLLDIPVSFTTALSIEALWLLLKSGAFMIPASLGASEGIALFVCMSLGLGSVAGLALGLVRRGRELVWVGLGLIQAASK